jgi:hypothetical protein
MWTRDDQNNETKEKEACMHAQAHTHDREQRTEKGRRRSEMSSVWSTVNT